LSEYESQKKKLFKFDDFIWQEYLPAMLFVFTYVHFHVHPGIPPPQKYKESYSVVWSILVVIGSTKYRGIFIGITIPHFHFCINLSPFNKAQLFVISFLVIHSKIFLRLTKTKNNLRLTKTKNNLRLTKTKNKDGSNNF
jgi:hypothetical protein